MFSHRSIYSYGVATGSLLQDAQYKNDPRYWTNPLESSLPYAPNMKIYCMYGIGKGTERAYFYKKTDVIDKTVDKMKEKNLSDEEEKVTDKEIEEKMEKDTPCKIDNTINVPEERLHSGVQDTEGDGTVPLLSLGTPNVLCQGLQLTIHTLSISLTS